ncbi:hypothetical protein F5984_07060 [Rudanella paleaurantiibacter]|uniref:Uncharacterized protein n=1 Tax=Rudanella paleaurantiibacter TaxID=2614655 RepID=A0A7J5U3A1_9BACT|nr:MULTISPECIES: hypothetical protein [Rudanella]KAB7731972.1 hypothetical protein F5984_07060 [Rudanella paleaurantiibacter]
MTADQLTEFFHDVLISMHENIRDLQGKKVYADPQEQDYLSGRLFSYHEVLQIMKFSAREAGLDEKELGL